MGNRLREFADNHAAAFWVSSILLFFALGYKTVSVVFLGRTAYQWDVAFLHLSIALLVIIMMKELYKGDFSFNFRTKNLWKGFLLGCPAYVWMFGNLFDEQLTGPFYPETLLMIFAAALMFGFYEEVLMRGFLVGHMMRHWQNDPRRIAKTVLVSSLFFGLIHLGNLIYGDVLGTLLQVIYSAAAGVFFAAVYLRTKNLWTVIILHTGVDFSAFYPAIFAAPGSFPENSGGSGGIWLYLLIRLLVTVTSIACGLFLLRKKKAEEIQRMWS